MYVLYFTVFTGVESVPPGMSDLGVMIIIGFWYAMQREGKEESEEASSPYVRESTLHGDAVPSLTRPHNGMKSAVMGYLPHYLLLWEQPELLIDLFPMMRMRRRILGESLPMLRRCRMASREDATKPCTHPKMKGTDPEETMIYLKAQSN